MELLETTLAVSSFPVNLISALPVSSAGPVISTFVSPILKLRFLPAHVGPVSSCTPFEFTEIDEI